MQEIQEKYIDYKNYKIHLTILEKNKTQPSVIFIPGAGCHSMVYKDFLQTLSLEGFNVFGVDLPGHGKSSGKRGNATYSEIMGTISQVADYIAQNYNQKIGICGSSLGGFIALYAGIENKKIKCVVSHNVLDLDNLPMMRKDLKIPKFLIPFLCKIFANIYIPLENLFDWNLVFEEKIYLTKLKKDKLMVWKYTLRSISSLFVFTKDKPKVVNMQTPVMILVGERDRIITAEYCKSVFEKLSCEKEYVKIPDAGHMLFVEYIPEVIFKVSEFFKKFLK
jgi:pimeloyl-ACP methyl ester carboxylesterase